MNIIIGGNEKIIAYVDAADSKDKAASTLKPSRFNYAHEANGGFIVYNTLYNALIRLTAFEYKKLNGQAKIGKIMRKTFVENGLLVRESTDELKKFLGWSLKQRKLYKPYLSLNITTTMKCNAHCSYCYEKGVSRQDFLPREINHLLKFIERRVTKDETLVLNWFGGEPLLNQNMIEQVTDALKKSKINFASYIITNGSLINKTMVTRKYKKWKVRDVQITLDGKAETYANRKNYQPQIKDVFDKILTNIELLAQNMIRVHIRLNVDRENMEEILAVQSMLDERFCDFEDVTYYPAFLTGVGLDLTENEKLEFLRRMIAQCHDPKNMNMARRFFSMPKYHPCMRNDMRSFSVDTKGNIYACEHFVGRKEYSFSNLSNYDESFNADRYKLRIAATCKSCVFLPKCMGGCAANRLSGDEPCMIEKYLLQGYIAHLAEL
ncbi:MAG: radical SAM protein [Prevotellaceae bacterium]|nr:radical SAM protein [Prevotellaceae bacterium]